jgi:hypothetical protein
VPAIVANLLLRANYLLFHAIGGRLFDGRNRHKGERMTVLGIDPGAHVAIAFSSRAPLSRLLTLKSALTMAASRQISQP